jgi:hypothetical protein
MITEVVQRRCPRCGSNRTQTLAMHAQKLRGTRAGEKVQRPAIQDSTKILTGAVGKPKGFPWSERRRKWYALRNEIYGYAPNVYDLLRYCEECKNIYEQNGTRYFPVSRLQEHLYALVFLNPEFRTRCQFDPRLYLQTLKGW